MARRRRRKEPDRRDTTWIANEFSLPRPSRPLVVALPDTGPLIEFEDRRRWHPEMDEFRPAVVVPMSSAGLVVPTSRRRQLRARQAVPRGLSFRTPKAVVICVRRKRRKEVMFASGRAGKRGQRKPRRSEWSSISCRG